MILMAVFAMLLSCFFHSIGLPFDNWFVPLIIGCDKNHYI